MSSHRELVKAVSYDLSQDFATPEEISKLVEALGSPVELALARNLDRPGAFWLNTFEPWLETDFEVRRAAINKAYRRLFPRRALPGTPTLGN